MFCLIFDGPEGNSDYDNDMYAFEKYAVDL